MATLEDLKAKVKEKGFFGLSAEEKVEYRALTGKGEKEVKAAPTTVEVSKTQFDSLIQRVQQLEREKEAEVAMKDAAINTGWQITSDKYPQKQATLRVYVDKEGVKKYIVNYKEQPNSPRWNAESQQMENWFNIELLEKVNEDGSFETSTVALEISDWAKLEREWLNVVGKEEKEMRKYTGQVYETVVDYEHYRSKPGALVDQYEYSKRWTYTMQLPDGSKIKLNSNILNS